MKKLKNRKTAILITVIVAIMATLFGVHRSLNKLARDIENMFYEEGYEKTNIAAQLNKQAEAALGVVAVSKNYIELNEQTEELRQRRLELLDAETIPEKGMADLRLWFAFEGLLWAAEDAPLSERDKTALAQYYETFTGAARVIDSGRVMYNDEVTKFQSGKSYSAIAGFLKPFVFVESPQLFINMQS